MSVQRDTIFPEGQADRAARLSRVDTDLRDASDLLAEWARLKAQKAQAGEAAADALRIILKVKAELAELSTGADAAVASGLVDAATRLAGETGATRDAPPEAGREELPERLAAVEAEATGLLKETVRSALLGKKPALDLRAARVRDDLASEYLSLAASCPEVLPWLGKVLLQETDALAGVIQGGKGGEAGAMAARSVWEGVRDATHRDKGLEFVCREAEKHLKRGTQRPRLPRPSLPAIPGVVLPVVAVVAVVVVTLLVVLPLLPGHQAQVDRVAVDSAWTGPGRVLVITGRNLPANPVVQLGGESLQVLAGNTATSIRAQADDALWGRHGDGGEVTVAGQGGSRPVKIALAPARRATAAPTLTRMPTSTPAPTFTSKPSPTRTATDAPTITPTLSPAPTATDAPTITPTLSPAPTATDTPTPTPTPTSPPIGTFKLLAPDNDVEADRRSCGNLEFRWSYDQPVQAGQSFLLESWPENTDQVEPIVSVPVTPPGGPFSVRASICGWPSNQQRRWGVILQDGDRRLTDRGVGLKLRFNRDACIGSKPACTRGVFVCENGEWVCG